MRSLWEPIGLTAVILILLKGAQLLLPNSWVAVLVPALLLYAPFTVSIYHKRPIDFLDRSWSAFGKGVGQFLLWTVIIFPPYLVAAHLWMIFVFKLGDFHPAPATLFFQNAWYQLLVVALPEEFFFRGYLQSSLQNFFRPKWKIFGISLGWGWILTALIFAFAHSLLQLQWWHFSIFFPALLFGYLREKTGSITAPILFHAFSNCFMHWFAGSYF